MDYCVSIYDFWTSMCEHVQWSKFCENASGLLLMPEVSAQYVWCAAVQGSCNDLWSWSAEYQYSRIQDAGAAKQVAGFLPRFYQINPDLRQMSQGKQRKGHTRGHWLRYIVTFWVTSISFHSLLPPLFLPVVLLPQHDSYGSAAGGPCSTHIIMYLSSLIL